MTSIDSMKEDINFTDNEIEFLKQSCDNWIAKYQETKSGVKGLKNRIRYLEKNRKRWKNLAQELKAKLAQKQAELDGKNKELEILKQQTEKMERQGKLSAFSCFPASHNYSIGQIMLFISLVLSATTSFRGASRAMELVYSALSLGFKAPKRDRSAVGSAARLLQTYTKQTGRQRLGLDYRSYCPTWNRKMFGYCRYSISGFASCRQLSYSSRY